MELWLAGKLAFERLQLSPSIDSFSETGAVVRAEGLPKVVCESLSNIVTTIALYYKRFRIVIYDHKGTLQFAAYLTVVIYAPS